MDNYSSRPSEPSRYPHNPNLLEYVHWGFDLKINHFVRTEIGRGLLLHSAPINKHIVFCIAAPAGLSLTDLLTRALKRELMIEIHGLDDHEFNLIVNDPLFQSTYPSASDECLQFTTPNNLLEGIYNRVCELLP